jgi:predicted methyltransferase
MVHKAAPEVITANIERMPESVVKNETELGLDVEGTSKLKADPDAVEAVKALDVIDAAAAADAYAEGAKEDPLGKTGTTKRSKAK